MDKLKKLLGLNTSSETKSSESKEKLAPDNVPPTKPLEDRPWRNLGQTTGKKLEEETRAAITKLDPVEIPRILLYGPVGAGKSSFINACLAVGIGRKSQLAPVGSVWAGNESLTRRFQHYEDDFLLSKIKIGDCMGIEGDSSYRVGFNETDLDYLLKGHIKKGYKFDPKCPINPNNKEYYIKEPTYADKVHCVVFVLSARSVFDGMSKSTIEKIKSAQQQIIDAGISRILVLTKADLLCEEVEANASKMFRSIKVHTAVKMASEIFSIPIASIHPVINYEVDTILSTEKNIPILLALRQIVEDAYDRVNHDIKNTK